MKTLLFLAAWPCGSWARAEESLDIESQVRAAYVQYMQAGRTEAEKKILQDKLATWDEDHGEDPKYLLMKCTVLRSWGDSQGARAIFALVPDDSLQRSSDLFNRLTVRLQPGSEIESATKLMERLAGVNSDALARKLHDSYAQSFAPKLRKDADLPRAQACLSSLKSPEAIRVAAGLRLWLEALEAKRDPVALKAVHDQLVKLDAPSADRYRLLLCKLLVRHESLKPLSKELLEQTIKRLQRMSFDKASSEETDPRRIAEDRAKTRYHLAHACYLRAQLFDEPLPWLQRAARSSPDAEDMQRGSFFYEQATLGGKPQYRSVFAKFLERDNQPEEALQVWTKLAQVDPESVSHLRDAFDRLGGDGDFDTYWENARDQTWTQAKGFSISTLSGQSRALADYQGQWLLLDFWGTWCAPCRRELPELQEFVEQLRSQNVTKASVLTIACRDSKETVSSFMEDNGYDFDVAMGDESILDSFQIQGFPAKILISPQGKWRAIGSKNWRHAVEEHLRSRSSK